MEAAAGCSSSENTAATRNAARRPVALAAKLAATLQLPHSPSTNSNSNNSNSNSNNNSNNNNEFLPDSSVAALDPWALQPHTLQSHSLPPATPPAALYAFQSLARQRPSSSKKQQQQQSVSDQHPDTLSDPPSPSTSKLDSKTASRYNIRSQSAAKQKTLPPHNSRRSPNAVASSASLADDNDNDDENDDENINQNQQTPKRSRRLGNTKSNTAKKTRTTTTPSRSEHATPTIHSNTPIPHITQQTDNRDNQDDDDLEESDPDDLSTAAQHRDGLESASASYAQLFTNLHMSTAATSNNTMSKLPVLEPKEFHRVMAQIKPKHTKEKKLLADLHRLRFPQWYFELDAGFNLLLYGFGSKRQMLQDFAREVLCDAPVVVINGFFPSISLKDILSRITVDILGRTSGPTGSVQDQLRFIMDYFASPDRDFTHIYVLIHNIDGSNLRNEKTQTGLSLLADCKHIRMIASIDHINASLLWDTTKLARFNWLWQDATTFEGYQVETSFESSFMFKQSDLGIQGVIYVLKSLTPNVRKTFRLLVQHQLTSLESSSDDPANYSGDPDTQTGNLAASTADTPSAAESSTNLSSTPASQMWLHGLTFERFFQEAYGAFFVNNEITFKTMLTEFRDHTIIKSRRRADGTEVLYIPLDSAVLRKLLTDTEW